MTHEEGCGHGARCSATRTWVLLQCAIPCGVRAGNRAFAVAQRILDEEQSAPG